MPENKSTPLRFFNIAPSFRSIFAPARYRLLFLSTAHALGLVVLTLFSLQLAFTSNDEIALIKVFSLFRQRLFVRAYQPDPDRFLFINLAYDKALVEKKDENDFPVGNQSITDRQKIARLLHILNQSPAGPLFLVIDVRFEDKSSQDSSLVYEFARTRHYLVSYHAPYKSAPALPVLPAQAGLSDFELTREGDMVKFSSVQADTARTTPLLMYQHLYGKTYRQGWLADWMGNEMCHNGFILQYRVRVNADSLKNNSPYHYAHLGELLTLPPTEIQHLARNRIVILGDFEDLDVHSTLFGELPGPVILLNAFLALEQGDNRLPLYFILLIFTGYWLLSYRCFARTRAKPWLQGLPLPEEIKRVLSDFLWYWLSLTALSILTYLLFNIPLTIFFTALYFQLLGGALRLRSYFRELKAQNTLLDRLVLERTQDLIEKNRQIQTQNDEILAQADALKQQNDYISDLNENLEKTVAERTQQLQETNSELDLYLYRSYHDFRRPLNSITGLSNLGKILQAPLEFEELFERINRTSVEMDNMLRKMQMLHLIDNYEKTPQPTDLSQLLTQIQTAYQSTMDEGKIEYNCVCGVPPFLSFPELWDILLRNLIENAMVFANKHQHPPFVKVKVSLQAQEVLVTVSDNGIGIAPEIEGKIYEQYFRGTEQSTGNGLGLYLVRKVLDELKGEISLISALAQGSTFVARIPLPT